MTANQLTFGRLLLLPVPVVLLYTGISRPPSERSAWLLAALGVYVGLGLTDALDGMLARRHGSTPLGSFLDPLVDKIFLVAAFLPAADLGIVSRTGVVVLFVRELGVTALRSIAEQEKFSFRTTRIAKLKTTVQMAGAGFLLLIWLFPGRAVIVPLLTAALAAALLPAAVTLLRGRRPGWKAISAAVLIGGVAGLRLALPQRPALESVMLVIVAFTVVSGAQYTWAMRHVLVARFARSPIELLRLLGVSLTVPLCYLGMIGRGRGSIVAILLLLAAELAVGGLENWLDRSGLSRGPGADIARVTLQAAVGLTVLTLASQHGMSGRWASLLIGLAAALTLADFASRLMANRRLLIAAQRC